MKEAYLMSKEEVFREYGDERGLTSERVSEKQNNTERTNLPGRRKKHNDGFLSQFADLLVIILIVAAVISMISGNVESTIVILP